MLATLEECSNLSETRQATIVTTKRGASSLGVTFCSCYKANWQDVLCASPFKPNYLLERELTIATVEVSRWPPPLFMLSSFCCGDLVDDDQWSSLTKAFQARKCHRLL